MGILTPLKSVVELSGSTTLLSGSKNVTTAGTAEALAASTSARRVVVQAKKANTGSVYVGNATSQDIDLGPGDSVELAAADLADIYIDVATSGEGVHYYGEA